MFPFFNLFFVSNAKVHNALEAAEHDEPPRQISKINIYQSGMTDDGLHSYISAISPRIPRPSTHQLRSATLLHQANALPTQSPQINAKCVHDEFYGALSRSSSHGVQQSDIRRGRILQKQQQSSSNSPS